VTTSPAATHDYWHADLRGGVAVVIGPEHEGLDERWRSAADLDVRIPMASAVDSLNAATAGALVLFEAVRQGRASEASGSGDRAGTSR
jgi:RNA methyltransferase, TrmH family